ncbi:hypothetical protein [Nannocystis pusilla]|uniref:hypothetical protein n=1 Tax=Nannocystis pusilla TaxID=889268 RepID=UPI003B7E3CFC
MAGRDGQHRGPLGAERRDLPDAHGVRHLGRFKPGLVRALVDAVQDQLGLGHANEDTSDDASGLRRQRGGRDVFGEKNQLCGTWARRGCHGGPEASAAWAMMVNAGAWRGG